MHHPFIDSVLSSLSTSAPQWTEEQDAPLLEPYTYVASSPGKGVRSQLIQALNHWLQVPSPELEAIIRIIELLHNASLLVDDIEDNSELRRGKPVAHKIYGVPQTINAANYVYFLAYQEVLKISEMDQGENQYIHCNSSDFARRLVQILNDEMLASHRGQGRELIWRDYLQCPTEEEYVQMAKDKTGGQFRLALRLMMECSTANTDVNYLPLVELLGIWFQIRDDYVNLQSESYAQTKGFAEDLEEGKFSFPIVHSMRERPLSKYLTTILHQRPKCPIIKQHTISYLKEETHSFEYTLSVLHSLEAQARAELTGLGGNPLLETIFGKLAI
ncbi:isoprenoid synthase domain-containing protein [Chiua virens]|nr:isoprenoid synthase domain-containing protein [Chiua virens]